MLASKLFRSLYHPYDQLFSQLPLWNETIYVVFFHVTNAAFLFYFLLVFFTSKYGKSSITDGEQKLLFDREIWKVSLTIRKKIFIFYFLIWWVIILYLQMIEYFMKFLSQDYHSCTSLSNCLIMWWYFITSISI